MSYLDYRYGASDVPQFDAAQAPAGAAGGFALSNPMAAGISVGGAFLSNYLAQRAADERARRDREVQIAQNQAEGEQNAFRFLDNVYKGALR